MWLGQRQEPLLSSQPKMVIRLTVQDELVSWAVMEEIISLTFVVFREG